jgi:hypothetical protein
MIAIKPVSDLRNYNEVLQDVTDESPVFNPYDEEHRGGTILRGKGLYYKYKFYGHY